MLRILLQIELLLTRPMAIKIEMCPESDSPPTERPSSVMEPYRKGLRLVKFLGLPVKIQITDKGVCFEDYLRLVKGGFATGNADFDISYFVVCKVKSYLFQQSEY